MRYFSANSAYECRICSWLINPSLLSNIRAVFTFGLRVRFALRRKMRKPRITDLSGLDKPPKLKDGHHSRRSRQVTLDTALRDFEGNRLIFEKTPSPVSIPPYQNGTMAKDAWWIRKVYWRRERAHDKTGKRVVVYGVYSTCIFRVHR